MRNAFLVGNRIYLRPLDDADVDFCVQHLNSPAVTRFLDIRGPLNHKWEQEWFDKLYTDSHNLVLGISEVEPDQLIGVTGLDGGDGPERCAQFGIWIAEPYWNQGYGTATMRLIVDYGFLEMNLNRIFLRVAAFNKRAMAVYSKVGFQLEGTLRQHIYRQGAFHDLHCMGLLRNEWENRKG